MLYKTRKIGSYYHVVESSFDECKDIVTCKYEENALLITEALNRDSGCKTEVSLSILPILLEKLKDKMSEKEKK